MRRRFIITSSIAIILFAVCLFGINVYAKMNQSFSISNTIAVEPSESVYVALDCSVSGCTQANLTTPPSGYESIEAYRQAIGLVRKVDFKESMRGQNSQSLLSDWNIAESLTFVNASTPIVYQIVVHNYSLVAIRVSFVSFKNNSEFISNTKSPDGEDGIVLQPYGGEGSQPDSKVITLTTRVKRVDVGFNDEPNDFTIKFDPIVE